MAQSIGLHVESAPSNSAKATESDHRRRTWYSLYVLDRLLALQLGRPMAIHEEDFKVELPDRGDPWAFGLQKTPERDADNSSYSHASLMDYFLKVIRFSDVVGLVIRELYRPSQVDLSPDQLLHSASLLDQHLTEWKAGLPRHLRFDLGHTFERSISFKRQVCSPSSFLPLPSPGAAGIQLT